METPDPESQPNSFMRLHKELRLQVYRELLVADGPIPVHSGWRHVYRRRSRLHGARETGVSIDILSTSRRIMREALPILYGENTFHYLLRDPRATVADVSRIAQLDDMDDLHGESDEAEDMSDGPDGAWGPEARRAARNRSRRQERQQREADIDIDQFRFWIRHIVVEAEPNRHSASTMRFMTRALDVFARDTRGASPWIKTLTVRVAPRRIAAAAPPLDDDDGDDDDDDAFSPLAAVDKTDIARFTFVDFFQPGSPVLAAIKAVDCDFLHVDLMARYVGEQSQSCRGRRLVLDRRPENLARHFFARRRADDCCSTAAVRLGRKCRALDARRALDELGGSVAGFCADNVVEVFWVDDDDGVGF
ncbi:hypothetical protein CDD83_7087 [Cordyceps sp. RAO-2017]|nr:hypothetical protein CDD83_7087 [Cordyceps sp. RAO-2017]